MSIAGGLITTISQAASDKGLTAPVAKIIAVILALLSIGAIGFQYFILGLILFLLNRLCLSFDLPDKTARVEGTLVLPDILFYALLIFVFVIGHQNFAMAAAFLFFAWMIDIGSVLNATLTRVDKTSIAAPAFFFLDGIRSRVETGLLITLLCLAPAYFPAIAIMYAALNLLISCSRALQTAKAASATPQ
jgi:hypothetical protein